MPLSKLIARIEPVLSILAMATALLPYLAATFDKVPLRPSLDWLPPVTMALSAIAALLGLQVRPSPRVILLPIVSAIVYFALVTFFPAPLNSETLDRVLRFFLGVTYVASFTGISFAAAAIVRQLAAMVTSTAEPSAGVPSAKTMRILVVAANPTRTTPLDLESEIRSLEEQLRQVKYRDAISLKARLAASSSTASVVPTTARTAC